MIDILSDYVDLPLDCYIFPKYLSIFAKLPLLDDK